MLLLPLLLLQVIVRADGDGLGMVHWYTDSGGGED